MENESELFFSRHIVVPKLDRLKVCRELGLVEKSLNMEAKNLNIAAILREKPKGIKLWSSVCGVCYLNELYREFYFFVDSKAGYCTFYFDGRYSKYGEVCIFPSKLMRDWSKFAWKKGDVLKAGVDNFCIFEKWHNDDYTEFDAKFVTDRYSGEVLKTRDWSKETNGNIIEQYISKIEENKGGKLNLNTLEKEKPQFKDGDIVTIYEDKDGEERYKKIVIFKDFLKMSDGRDYIAAYAEYDIDEDLVETKKVENNVVIRKFRLATDSEKQQIFGALAEKGKAWDCAENQIIDLPKKPMFEPFQKVLVRDYKDKKWDADFFSYYDSNLRSPYQCVGGNYNFCLPYNDKTKHLLGTANEMEWR